MSLSAGRRRAGLGLVVAMVAVGCAQDVPSDGSGSSSPGVSADVSPAPSASAPASEEVPRAAPTSADADVLADGLNDAGFVLFGHGVGETSEDVVISPLSIGLAFGMADVGATGATSEALRELFDYPGDGEQRWSAFNTIEQDVTGAGGPVVRVANRQYPDVSFDTAPGYDQTLQRWFGTGIEPLPLQTEPEQSRAHINDWVAEQTEQLIPELVPEGMVTSQSVMLLVNALYLQADWERPFGKYPTEDATFTRLDGSEVTVPLMHERELSGPAVATDTYAATEVPYDGGELSMLVIVPQQGHYQQVEDALSDELLAEIDAAATTGTVELWLPRFESDSRLDLRQSFEALGVEDVFGTSGSWDGIAPGISLESGVHAADISVDEHGTVAAAATALGFEESGPPEPDVTVRADTPFLYLIRHQPTGAVLFAGRVADPSA